MINDSLQEFKVIQIINRKMQISINEAGHSEENFFFEALPNKLMEDKDTKQILAKWGLADTLRVGSYRFNQSFNQFQLDSFLKDLLSSPNLRYVNNNIKFGAETVSKVHYDRLNCTQLTTELFEVLEEQKIVIKDYIGKTFGDQFEGIEICDKLRECLLLEESEHYATFSHNQRKQLLFRIFQLLVIGGSLNQYEDLLSPYLEWTKKLYKSVVAVKKQAESGHIFIDSLAVEVTKVEKDGYEKGYNPQSVLYVVICPSIRTVHVISNQWIKFW